MYYIINFHVDNVVVVKFSEIGVARTRQFHGGIGITILRMFAMCVMVG